MKYADIAIIGGGLAGSTAAAMLGRAGIPTILIDPHQVYPFDFRVEKISGDEQFGRFYQTGIADSVLRSATHDGENCIARFGYLLDKKPSRQYGGIDAWSMAKAVSFRKLTIENGLYWRAQRWARFLAWFGEGCLRRMRNGIGAGANRRAHSSSSSSSSSSSLSSSA